MALVICLSAISSFDDKAQLSPNFHLRNAAESIHFLCGWVFLMKSGYVTKNGRSKIVVSRRKRWASKV